MRLVLPPIPGVFETDAGAVQVRQDAPSMSFLVGCEAKGTVIVASVLNCGSDAAKNFAEIDDLLPGGLSVVGLFVLDAKGKPTVPSQIPAKAREAFKVVASKNDDGTLAAWEINGSSTIAECTVDGSALKQARACFRGRLNVSAAAPMRHLSKRVEGIPRDLTRSVYFVFPGSTQAALTSDLKGAAPKTEGEIVSVMLLSDSLGDDEAMNFAQLQPKDLALAVCDLDFAVYMEQDCSLSDAAKALLQMAERQLKIASAVIEKRSNKSNGVEVTFRLFQPDPLCHLVCLHGTQDETVRKRLHGVLHLPQVPLLKAECALPAAGCKHPLSTGKLECAHEGCGMKPTWWKASEDETETAFVKGKYEYFHYMQDKFDDNGWGCAYRSLQTCVSWYRMQAYSTRDVPPIPDIQSMLKKIDEAHKELKVGSKTWIGTIEGMYCLQHYVGVDCRMLYCQDAEDMVSQAPALLAHLRNAGTPVMMGCGQYAYTLIGLCYNSNKGEAGFLIADPHYTGADELKTILNKGWVGWKNIDFFKKSSDGSFINLCLPQAPTGTDFL